MKVVEFIDFCDLCIVMQHYSAPLNLHRLSLGRRVLADAKENDVVDYLLSLISNYITAQ